MRFVHVMLLAAAFSLLMGCEQLQTALSPMPTTRGSRVTPRLQQIPLPDPANVKVVTVYRFQNKTGFPHGLAIANGMTDQLITALVKTGHFRVVERATLADVSMERQLQESGEATGPAPGTKMMGAELIFAGSVTELGETGGGGLDISRGNIDLGLQVAQAQVGLDMRIVDVGTSQVLDSIDVRKTVRKTGLTAGHSWGISGGVQITNALDLAIRETIEEAVYQLVMKYGAL